MRGHGGGTRCLTRALFRMLVTGLIGQGIVAVGAELDLCTGFLLPLTDRQVDWLVDSNGFCS